MERTFCRNIEPSRDDPPSLADVNEMHEEVDINVDTISKAEVKSALKDMKDGKPPGIDNIPVEMFKADVNMAVNTLYDIFSSVWNKEETPKDRKKGILIKLPKKGDLTSCGNRRGITLLTTTSKVLGRIIIISNPIPPSHFH